VEIAFNAVVTVWSCDRVAYGCGLSYLKFRSGMDPSVVMLHNLYATLEISSDHSNRRSKAPPQLCSLNLFPNSHFPVITKLISKP
jgi:hypothetical protein